MIKIKKSPCLLIMLLSIIFLLAVAPTAFGMTTKNTPTESEINAYLVGAGYPQDIINILSDESKLEFYEGEYTYESSKTSYGILTDNYTIKYFLDEDNRVIIDRQNADELQALLNDKQELQKITDNPTKNYSPSLNSINNDIQLMSLSNWSGTITCSHISYNNGIAKKKLTYDWSWDYRPVNFKVDRCGMAWSGGFTAEPTTFKWKYYQEGSRMATYPGATPGPATYTKSISTSDYTDYNPGAGIGIGFDLQYSFKYKDSTYQVESHSAEMSVTLTKATTQKTRESAVGTYYHKRLNANGTLTFSVTGPSISISNSSSYDKAPDSAVAFWSTSN